MMSSRPKAATVSSTRLWMSATLDTSAWTIWALPPAASISAFVAVGRVLVLVVVDRHRGALAGELQRDRAADAAVAAGDDRDLVLE